MDLGLQGKTVLITGGSKGIGLACADVFAAEGCAVHIAARNAQQLEAAQAQIQARHGVRITTHAVDLRDGAALKALAKSCAGADILVNNAGDIPGGTLEALDESKWRHAWELKVFGFINLTREMFGHMKSKPEHAAGGSANYRVIMNVIGMAAEHPSFEYLCGATANAGLAAFTKGLGKGSLEHGIRCLGVHPPSTRTDRITSMIKTLAKTKYGDENRGEDLIRDGILGRPIEPEQVADAVAFLSSRRAGILSGVMLNLGN